MTKKTRKATLDAASLDSSHSTDDWQDRDDLADEAGDLLADRQEQVAGDEPAHVPARQLTTPPRPSEVED